MSNTAQPESFHSPPWHSTAQTPVVDGKYIDRTTGEVRSTKDESDVSYQGGPPDVDIIIKSQHADTAGCCMRAARAMAMEGLLCRIMKVVGDRQLELDSIMATPYAIRVIICHEITKQEFMQICDEMINAREGETFDTDDDDSDDGKGEDEDINDETR